jgi:hypothetical protein
VKRDPDMPRVSLERWADADSGPILFITAHAPIVEACPSVRAMISAGMM